MYEDGIYNKILNHSQYARLLYVINKEPNAIFGSDEMLDDNYSMLQYEFLDYLIYVPVAFVGKKLIDLGFDVSQAFTDYLEDEDDY